MECLSTGLASLDSCIEAGGLRPESVVAIRTPARTVYRRLAFNCCADRPVHYCGIGADADRYESHITTATGLGTEAVTTRTVPLGDAFETLSDHLEGLGEDLEPGTTVVVDPTTPVETLGHREMSVALSKLRDVLAETGGLGLLLAVDAEDQPTPPGRWVTESRADAVLSVRHRTTTDSVTHHLAVDRLPMDQRLREDAARTFELPADLSMTLDASKTLSP